LEDNVGNQDVACQAPRYLDEIIQESWEASYGATAEMDGGLAKDIFAGVQGQVESIGWVIRLHGQASAFEEKTIR
jgi:hypothetical protein